MAETKKPASFGKILVWCAVILAVMLLIGWLAKIFFAALGIALFIILVVWLVRFVRQKLGV